MKKILVPTDFSECAMRALKVAVSIAKENNAKLFLMHIVNMPSHDTNSSVTSFESTTEGIFLLQLVKRKFIEIRKKKIMGGLEFEEILEYNSVYESISKQAKENDIDLVVMGSHGTSGAQEFFVGSNTERVVRSSEIPILTIKKEFDEFQVKNIVFASNFLKESYSIFGKIVQFAKIFNARIHLVKIVTPGHFETTKRSLKLMDDFVKNTELEINHTINVYNDTKIESGIHNFADEVDCDLIAMETHGRTGIKHMLWGSITEEVANHADIPVLSVRIPKVEESDDVIFPD